MPNSSLAESEIPIYNSLTEIRKQLSILKRDHSKFLDSKQITEIYCNVLDNIEQLNQIRGPQDGVPDPNKLDVLIDEIFQLLSLCFVTCGLTNTAPATYASLSTVQRLLEHLNESSIYTPHDLKPIKERLDEISNIIENNNTNNNNEITLLKNKLKDCYEEYQYMMDKMANLRPEIQQLIDSLLDIKYHLFGMITNDDHTISKVLDLTCQLSDCKQKSELIFTESPMEKGNGIVKGLIDNCSNYLRDLQMGVDRVDQQLRPLYEQLLKLKSTLTKLLVTRRWTLRTTDIFSYQKQLNEIDNSRVNGYFISKDLKGQSVILYLLRSCFAIIYKLLESSEPVSESLQPIHNQLSTVRCCLLDIKRYGGISSMRELYPYQLKLDSIDNMKNDGKFVIQNQIPEGQGAVVALLAECFDICHELKIEFEGKDSVQDSEKSFVVGTKADGYDYNATESEDK
ncbi:Cub1 protein [Martiniozyma asiatica (nom. inval.)]|nr:Cub1 protein [Martiniozyma asiatica]